INSPGGSVTATLAIYDTMQFLECPMSTYCVGTAASGAAILLAGGTKGKRYALPHSRIMLHQPWGQVGGQASDVDIAMKELLRMREALNDIVSRHTGRTAEVVERSGREERVFDIYSRLLKDRIIFLQGVVDDDSAAVIVAQMLYLQFEDPKADIHLYINSPGGSVTAGMAIYDTMNYIACDVATYCLGLAASMGATLLAA